MIILHSHRCLCLILHRIKSFTRHVDARHTGQAGRPERGLAHGAHAHRLPRRRLHAAQQGGHKLSPLVWALIRSSITRAISLRANLQSDMSALRWLRLLDFLLSCSFPAPGRLGSPRKLLKYCTPPDVSDCTSNC